MSRRNGNGDGQSERQEWTQEEALAIEQSLDLQMLEHVRELLCKLWLDGRVTIDVRIEAETALGAAEHAVAHPHLRNITPKEGAAAAAAAWLLRQRNMTHDF